jgi:hypothetical protein
VAVLASAAVWLAAILSPRLPKRIVLPPAGFALWASLGAAPLGLLVGSATARTAVATAGQLLLTLLAFALVRRRSGRWLLPPGALPGPAFRFRYSLGAAAIHALLLPPLAALYLALAVAEGLTLGTGRFVSFGAEGVQVEERRYQRGNREIVLAGMMHIGAGTLYRDLYASFVSESTVVLQEGISDEGDLLKVDLPYEPLAAAVGLRVQPELELVLEELRAEGNAEAEEWPHLWRADVDASDLQPETLAFVRRIGGVLSAEDPGVELRRHADWLNGLGADDWTALYRDLLLVRNERVDGRVDGALADYRRVVIPWGALHMPDLEQRVLARGFERVSARRRVAADYAALGRALGAALGLLVP